MAKETPWRAHGSPSGGSASHRSAHRQGGGGHGMEVEQACCHHAPHNPSPPTPLPLVTMHPVPPRPPPPPPARSHLVPQPRLVRDLPGAGAGVGRVHGEGARVHHKLHAAVGQVEQVHHLVLAVAHKALVVPGHKATGHNDVRLKALLVPAQGAAGARSGSSSRHTAIGWGGWCTIVGGANQRPTCEPSPATTLQLPCDRQQQRPHRMR